MNILENNYSKKSFKPWTVLIYANGNNDLEPEISKSLLDIESIGSGNNVNVIIQLARAPHKLVKTMRPNYLSSTNIDGDWSGVRRYLVKETPTMVNTKNFHSELINNLGNINMADPATLKDFICFGIKNFPAKHYMLILQGHGAGFMGILPDYTLKSPQIMSINGVNMAIHRAVEEVGKKIDVLLFDSCYMNMIECLYEFGIDSKSPSYLITPEASPLEGLPYDTIMKVFRNIGKEENSITLIKNLVNEVDKVLDKKKTNLLAFRLDSNLLRLIKASINSISSILIENKLDIKKYAISPHGGYPSINIYNLPKVLETVTDSLIMSINTSLLKICTKNITLNLDSNKFNLDNNSLSLFTANNDYVEFIKQYYFKMRFAHNNKWIQYLLGKNKDYKFNTVSFRYSLPPSDDMPLEGIINVILSHNPRLNQEGLNKMIGDLRWTNCYSLK